MYMLDNKVFIIFFEKRVFVKKNKLNLPPSTKHREREKESFKPLLKT